MSMLTSRKKKLSLEQSEALIGILKVRFAKNMERHKGIKWSEVEARLEGDPEKLWSIHEMEASGGEPDVVSIDHNAREYLFCDCAAETPKGRRSLCYDDEALDSRKENKPAGSAAGMAAVMGIKLLTEDQYRKLQQLGKFDLKTSSWIETPARIRELGGALFCDRRYDHVFTYHNGAESYYAARAFRGCIGV